ncbi:MAG: glycosyltransferase family 1 protein [Pseudopedobacter saltans]|uniref:Glycosyltransferase family 1 protein n=1 Tax=Pseudopedobacter saltans TaxID=151895 RepID=A0A2W5F2P6_9SPHI|nr:MAG: glycosyltransferase family 1 protein [Pseudopedobacter saltans]
MKVAIIGTRGIPNNYGGFEQFAEYLSLGLVKRGHEVTVYNSHNHAYQEKTWHGVQIIHKFDPEKKIGTAGQFIYDLGCIWDTRKHNFDIILQLGYTSSTVWGWLLPRKKSIVATNMDGIEWRRSKFSKRVQRFLKYAESLAIKYSDDLISDSKGVQRYLMAQYDAPSIYIPYGAEVFNNPDVKVLDAYNLEPYQYNMLIARLEPENSIDRILDGMVIAESKLPFLVIGNYDKAYGDFLRERYKDHSNIRFLNSIYDINILDNLRYYSRMYFHGHTVGGTNPSLLEAMASSCTICAHKNVFNETILGKDAYYFLDSKDVANYLLMNELDKSFVPNNIQKIETLYTWDNIVNQYEDFFKEILKKKK